jgi:hypothetical protein
MKQVLFIIMLFILGSCGTTLLVTYNSNVDIYVNNQFKGKGQATITRTGPPQKSHIDAKHNGGQVGSMDIHREVKFTTVVIGLYTYGIGFFLSWKYPETVIIPINDIQENKSFDPVQSIWDLPPGEWRK